MNFVQSKLNDYAKQTQFAERPLDVQIAVTLVKTRNYNNEQRTMNYELLYKTNPIQTQYKAKTNPIPEMSKMNANAFSQKDCENETAFRPQKNKPKKKPNTNPKKCCPGLGTVLAIEAFWPAGSDTGCDFRVYLYYNSAYNGRSLAKKAV